MTSATPAHGTARRDGTALPIVLAFAVFLAMVRIMLARDGVMPMHDTFHRFCLQWANLWNEPALGHGIPQWNPWLCHGMANYWHLLAGMSMLGAVLPIVAPVLHGLNGFGLGHATLLVDELALLLGCVLLARRWYASPATAVFVAAAVSLTAVSFAQFNYNLRLICLVPLLLYCGDRALRDGSARHLAGMAALGAGMIVLNLAYVAPLLAFMLLVFAACLALCSGRRTAEWCRSRCRLSLWRHALVLAAGAALVALIWCYLHDCVGGAHVFRREDSTSAQVSLTTFMSYGGCISISKYLELVWRHSNKNDLSLYAGMLLVPCVCVALVRARSPLASACGITALVLVLFSSGTCVSVAFYRFFPLGSMYRHIALSAPLAKLFIVLYAGFGFDALWRSMRAPVLDRVPVRVAFAALGVLAVLVLAQRLGVLQWYAYTSQPEPFFPPWHQLYLSPATMALVDARVCHILAAFAAIMGLACLAPRFAPAAAWASLIVHCADVATYKVEMETTRLPTVSPELHALFAVRPYEFAKVRAARALDCPAIATVSNDMSRYCNLFHMVLPLGPCDPVWSPFRVDLCEEPFFKLLRVWNTNAALCASYETMTQPASAAFAKASGLDMPKLQMFSCAHGVTSDIDAAAILGRTNFSGDRLLVSRAAMASERMPGIDTADRLTNAAMEVRSFSFDRLALDVVNPAAHTSVLYYADTWHPSWRATVKGTAAPVLRANIAYKAVEVPPGMSAVVFSFGTPWSTFLMYTMVGIAALVLCVALWLCGSDVLMPALRAGRRGILAAAACVVGGAALCAIIAYSPAARSVLQCGNLTRSLDVRIAASTAALAVRSNDVAALVARADLYRHRGNLLAAVADYDAARALDPACGPALHGLCEVYYAKRNSELMARAFVNAVRHAAATPAPPQNVRGQIAAEAGACITEINRAPDDPAPYLRLALLRLRMGDTNGAAADFGAVLRLMPILDAKAFNTRGDACTALGLREQAAFWYTESVKRTTGAQNGAGPAATRCTNQ